ncbi:DUF6049 family protein [Cellulomonas sp. McL0617]|uniref:DUF6049 family protein n=1 Tax=Cellulomonas sp. McL0617 TaxID=3415675 RepID=UPI003CE83502
MSARSTLRRVLCAALALGAALTFAAPADAADATPLSVTVHVDQISPSVLRPGQDLTVAATVTNTGTDVVEKPMLTLRLSRFLVSARDDLESWTSGTTCPSKSPCPQVAAVTLADPLGVGESASVAITLPAADVHLLDLPDTWGPRGLSVELLDGHTRVGVERTFLLWYPDESAVSPAPVSVLVPVVGPGADPLSPQSASLDSLVAPGGRLDSLTRTLAAHPDIGVAVDPALLASAAGGSTRAQAWASGLDADLAHHDVLALPWSDPDIGAAGHADQSALVQLAVDASSTAGIDASGILWTPTGGNLDQTTLAVAAQVHEPAVVVAPGSVEADKPKSGKTPEARTAVRTPAGTVHALVPDTRLSALLTDPTSVDAQATPATTTQRALAELAVVARETPSDQPHVLMTAGRDWRPDTATVAALLSGLDTTPWVNVTDTSTLLGTDAATGKATVPASAADPTALAPDQVRRLAAARDQAIAFATVTEEPDTLLKGVDAEVVAPLAVAWRAQPQQRADLVSRVLADLTTRTSGLSIAQLGDVHAVSSSNEVRMTVTNALDVPATVLLTVQPRKACLEAKAVPPVLVEAKTSTVVTVTLHAFANCEVVVDSRLTAHDGTPVSAPMTFTARVAPTIESVGTKVVGVLLAIGLVLGIVRTIRRGQSGRRGTRVDAEKPPPLPVLGGGEPGS